MNTICQKSRNHRKANLLIGPPRHGEDLEEMMASFFALEGKHIVCGGTTAQLTSVYLGKSLRVGLDYEREDIPPVGELEGVDLVTEGVITLRQVVHYCRQDSEEKRSGNSWCKKQDGASKIMRIIFEDADEIRLLVGTALNPAYRSPHSPIDPGLKLRVAGELAACLKKSGKQVETYYY